MTELNCSLGSSESVQRLTVGAEVVVNCTGESIVFDKSSARFEIDPKEKYNIQLLEVTDLSAKNISMIITSYRPGQHQFENLILTDGVQSYKLNNIQFMYESVIDPQQPPEKPFGPIGPLEYGFPYQIFAYVGLPLLLIFMVLFSVFRRRWQRKKLITEIINQGHGVNPLVEFSAFLRKFRKVGAIFNEGKTEEDIKLSFNEFDSAFRRYCTKTFLIPVHAWRAKHIINDFKERYPDFYEINKVDLVNTFKELDKIKAKSKLSKKDAAQMVVLCEKLIDKAEKSKKHIGASK